MTDEIVVWGVKMPSGRFLGGDSEDGPVWSFSKSDLADNYHGNVAPLPDHLAARVPKAGDAVVRYLQMKHYRRRIAGRR